MSVLIQIFSNDDPEDMQERKRVAFGQAVQRKAEELVENTNLHPEKQRMIPVVALGIAEQMAFFASINTGQIDEVLKRSATATRSNILKPAEGDYEYVARAIKEVAEVWATQNYSSEALPEHSP